MKRYLLLLFFALAFVYLKAESSIDILRLSDYLLKIEQSGKCIGYLTVSMESNMKSQQLPVSSRY